MFLKQDGKKQPRINMQHSCAGCIYAIFPGITEKMLFISLGKLRNRKHVYFQKYMDSFPYNRFPESRVE